MYITNKADSQLLNGSSTLEHRRSFYFGYIKNVSAMPKQKLRLSANLIGLFSEMPYLPYSNRWFESKTFVQFLKHASVIFLQRIGCEE